MIILTKFSNRTIIARIKFNMEDRYRMTSIKTAAKNKKQFILRCAVLCTGLAFMALGVAFSIKANLGVSPISSVPYITAYLSGLSTGTTTFIMNCLFVVIQILILRKHYDKFQLLQIPASLIFGALIDLFEFIIKDLGYSNYLNQWVYCVLGILFLAFGVSLEVAAGLITNAGEGIVLAICQVAPVKFGNMKVVFDVTLMCITIAISLIALHKLQGVREGTIAAAVCVGFITKLFARILKPLKERVADATRA